VASVKPLLEIATASSEARGTDGVSFMDRSQPIQQTETTEGAEQRGNRQLLYLAVFWCAALLVALGFRRSSAVYEWMNRVGVFLGLALTLGFFFWAQ
jgi:hypothetical protein